MLLRRKASPIKVHGEHAMRSRHGPTALEVACQTRDELRVAPHECTTAQLRTTTPGSTPARPRGKMRLCWKLYGNWCQAAIPDCLGRRTFWGGVWAEQPRH